MPSVPYQNPYVQYAGFEFNYNDAFVDCLAQYGVGGSSITISSFNTLSVSSLRASTINGTSYDTNLSTLINTSSVVGNLSSLLYTYTDLSGNYSFSNAVVTTAMDAIGLYHYNNSSINTGYVTVNDSVAFGGDTVFITGSNLNLNVNNTPGAPGEFLTSDGSYASWQTLSTITTTREAGSSITTFTTAYEPSGGALMTYLSSGTNTGYLYLQNDIDLGGINVGITGLSNLTLNISNSTGLSGQLLTSDGTHASWQTLSSILHTTATVSNLIDTANGKDNDKLYLSRTSSTTVTGSLTMDNYVTLASFNGTTISSSNSLTLSASNLYITANGSPGSNGQVLTASGATCSWQTPTGGGGATGPTGPAGPSSSYFNYRASTVLTNPASARITWQNSTQTDSTYFQVNHLDIDGVDVEVFLSSVKAGNTLIIQNADNSTNFQKWLVSAVTVVANQYVEYTVSLVTSSGADFADNHRIFLAILSAGIAGATGATGPTGVTTSLTNRVMATPVGTPSNVPLTWSSGSTPSGFVPLATESGITYRAPVAPTSGTGWRFNKTYNLITVATSGLTINNTYMIVTPGTINWVAIGAPNALANTKFTYNGLAITGTGGTAIETSKISWFTLNSLYGLTLPQTSPAPGIVSKADLQTAWFLVKFNADIAVQGSLAIQIDSYAYQYNSNTSNFYTGRWAYSFPLQQNVGFNALTTTNINAGANPGLGSSRLKTGFTYLLYAGDYSMMGASGAIGTASASYYPGGAGLFAPSQTLVSKTLRDPYDVYPDYPHMGLTSCSYTSNAIGPAYGGSNVYSDPAATELVSIYLNTSSDAPYSGTGQTVTDFQVLAMGYSTSNVSNSYTLTYV